MFARSTSAPWGVAKLVNLSRLVRVFPLACLFSIAPFSLACGESLPPPRDATPFTAELAHGKVARVDRHLEYRTDEDVIALVLGGTVLYSRGGKKENYVSGDSFSIPASSVSAFLPTSERPATVYFEPSSSELPHHWSKNYWLGYP